MNAQAGTGTALVQRVVVVDDHRTFADLLVLALHGLPDIECVGQAHDAAAARDLINRTVPDLAILDVELGADDGLELSAELTERHPDLRVVVLTAQATRKLLADAARSGACSVLTKFGSLANLLHAMRSVRRDAFVVDPSLLALVLSGEELPRHSPLSDRETDALAAMAEGLDARGAARRLGISIPTFRGHVRRVLVKLNAHSQLEALAIAKREGFLN